MAKLLYSARTSDGRPTQGYVDADSADGARARLLAQGLVDLVLHQEVAIATDEATLEGLSTAQKERLAAFTLKMRENRGLPAVLAETARRSALWLVVDAAVLVYALVLGNALMAVAAVGLIAFPFALTLWRYRHADEYQRLLRSFAIGRWEAAEESMRKLAPMRQKLQTVDFDLAVRSAAIQARRGRMDEALAGVQPWRRKLMSQPGLFEARVATVHSAGGDRNGFVRLMKESWELSKGEPSRTLDYAMALARFGDAQEAAQLLSKVDAGLLPPHASGFVRWAEGLIALRNNDTSAAVRLLGDGTAEFLKLADTPAVWTSLAFCTADLAIAKARTGRKDEARTMYRRVQPIVQAHADKPFLILLNEELADAPAAAA